MLRIFSLFISAFLLSNQVALGKTYYVAPPGTQTSSSPDGSEASPFSAINQAFGSGKIKGGDILLLMDGAYGSLTIKANAIFDTPVTIMSQNGKGAHFDNILLAGKTRNLTLRDLSVWPSSPEDGGTNYLVRAYDTTANIMVDGLDVRSEEGADSYAQWDADKWNSRKFSGILLQGPNATVANNQLTGIYHGIIVVEKNSLISNNTIQGFNGDGMRAGSHSLVQGNHVSDCVKTDNNHDDGFQAMSAKNLVIDSNVIIEWSGGKDHPLRCALQGIGLFDGPYENVTITNNDVAVTAIHGISVYGAHGAEITDNVVVNGLGQTGKYPYIGVYARKDGTPSTDVLVSDNFAMSFQVDASAKNRIRLLKNSVIRTPARVLRENPIFGGIPTAPPVEPIIPVEPVIPVAPPANEPAISPVPVPSAGLLLLGALGSLAALRRRKAN